MTSTDLRINYRDIAVALGYEEHSDCEGCGWRIMHCPPWKVFFADMDDEYAVYNHSSVRAVTPAARGYDVTIVPWNRKPGEPELVILEQVLLTDIRISDGLGGHWQHISPHHPSFSGDTKGVCGYARPKQRCPKCQSFQVTMTQEAWGDRTECPECGYNVFHSIGD